MLRRPEPLEWRIESTTLGLTAIEFPHSTRQNLQLMLRIQRYTWRITTPLDILLFRGHQVNATYI